MSESKGMFTPRKKKNTILIEMVRNAFDKEALRTICEMHEDDFAAAFGLETVNIPEREKRKDASAYFFQDNGADILAVAHLDTVSPDWGRRTRFAHTEDGLVVHSRALDDRLGAYIILDLLPKLGIKHDILLTLGEEDGQSTGEFFTTEKDYNWMIEFDRGGTDVVLYEYEDDDLVSLVKETGARVGVGAFSDISYMEHLEIKGLNWGVGYQDYHGPRAHAYLEDTFEMVSYYLDFHETNAEEYLPHQYDERAAWYLRGYSRSAEPSWAADDKEWEEWWAEQDEKDQAAQDAEDDLVASAEVRRFGELRDLRQVKDWDYADDHPTAEALTEVLGEVEA